MATGSNQSREPRVYGTLIRLGAATVDSIHDAINDESPGDIVESLNGLNRLGFVRNSLTTPGAYYAVEGSAVISDAIDLVTADLISHLRIISGVARETSKSTPMLTRDVGDSVQLIEGHDAIIAALRGILSSAQRHINSLVPFVPPDVDIRMALQSDFQNHQRGIGGRTIYPEAAVLSEPLCEYIDKLSSVGSEFRFNATIPCRLLVIDSEVAIVDDSAHNETPAALVVRAASLVRLLQIAFQSIWNRSTLYSEGRTATRMPRRERAVLGFLAKGMTESSISAELDVDVRTVRRDIKNLYTKAGVSSRFELALKAIHLGWLQLPMPSETD